MRGDLRVHSLAIAGREPSGIRFGVRGMRVLLLVVGLVGIAVFVLGPDTDLGPAALVVGLVLVAVSGSVWLISERRRDGAARDPRVPPRR